MDSVRSLYYIGPRMGHVTMFSTGWILDKAPPTKETLSGILLNYRSRYMGHNNAVLGHLISTSFL